MEIIPSIANYFGITIDELFGYTCERQSKIDALVQSIREKNKCNNGQDNGEHHLSDENGYDVLDTARHKQYAEWQEAIKLYEKLLLSLGDCELRHTAIRELIQLYVNTGENEKAKQIAANAPNLSICRELLFPNCCDGKERAEAYETTLGKRSFQLHPIYLSRGG